MLRDDIFDLLEGTLAELAWTISHARSHVELLILEGRTRDVRASVALLSALLRGGEMWRPAQDGHEATEWRDIVMGVLSDFGDRRYVAMLSRELDELVTLAAPTLTLPRRPLPSGSFERLARRAGVRRLVCKTALREVGDDHVAGWAACGYSHALVRIPIALGATADELVRGTARALLATTPSGTNESREMLELVLQPDPAIEPARRQAWAQRLDSRWDQAAFYVAGALGTSNLMAIDNAIETALFVVDDAAVLREHLTTPAMRERLVHPERA